MFERSVFNYQGLEVRITDHANEGILDILDYKMLHLVLLHIKTR